VSALYLEICEIRVGSCGARTNNYTAVSRQDALEIGEVAETFDAGDVLAAQHGTG
jgi:hypothetical protein